MFFPPCLRNSGREESFDTEGIKLLLNLANYEFNEQSIMSQQRWILNKIQCVPLATEPGISLIILPLMRILQRNLKRTTDTFLFISHTTNVLLFKFRFNIFIVVRIIKEMPGSVASGKHCIMFINVKT